MPKAPDEEEHAPDSESDTEDEGDSPGADENVEVKIDEVKLGLLVPEQLRVPPEFKNRMLVHLRKLKFRQFKPLQLEALYAHLDLKRDVLLSTATSGGKSLAFIISQSDTDKVVLIVSPLRALMEDQIHKLDVEFNMKGKSLMTMSGELSADERLSVQTGRVKFIFAAPEAILCIRSFLETLVRDSLLQMIVFDEVHCISLWGHTFRTAYLDCDAFRKSQLLRSIPQLLLSATVTSAVIRDLATILLLPDGFCFLKGDMNHPGHFYSFKPFTSNDVDLAPIMQSAIDAKGADPVVVFVDSKREAMDLWVWARDRFPEHADRCGVSHSLRSADDRAITGRLFSNGDLDVVICTSVMEMGIDNPRLTRVICKGAVQSIEAIQQRVDMH